MQEEETTVAFSSSAAASQLCWELLKLSPGERDRYLVEKCGGDEALLREVERRMGRATPDDFLELLDSDRSTADGETQSKTRTLKPGERLGNYRIERALQGGGMGEVYKAERVEPFHQTVAIKVIKPDLVDRTILNRFHEERQILADLDHPNIAKIYGGGLTPDGKPYYAMQYIDGQRLNVYCREKKLTVRERVELFLDIASAVEYAHRHLIVHRDLKPENILVTEDGQPLLLDFGIAKMLHEGDSSAGSSRNAIGGQNEGFVGTMLYASPEQIMGERITIASDIYSLGVLLFECLSGHQPYDLQGQWRRLAVGDEDLEPPSAVVGREAALAGQICEQRRCKNPEALKRALRGDLDAIVLKALHLQPEKRYATIEQLSGDLERYLTRRVVMARERTILYVLQKFIERNKVAVTAATILLVSVAMVLAMANHYEQRQARMIEALDEIVVHPDLGQLEENGLGELLAEYEDSDWFASLLHQTGYDLEQEGRFTAATSFFRESLKMKERLEGKEHRDLISTITQLAGVLAKTGQFKEAESYYLRNQEIRRALFGTQSLEYSRGLHNLGVLYQEMGNRLEQAGILLEESYAIREAKNALAALAATKNALAWQRHLEGDQVEAERLYLEVLATISETNMEPSKQAERTARVHRNLALVYKAQGRLQDAEQQALIAWRSFRDRKLYWRVADAESVLGAIRADQGRIDEARLLLEESCPIIRSVKGEQSRQTQEAIQRLREVLGEDAAHCNVGGGAGGADQRARALASS